MVEMKYDENDTVKLPNNIRQVGIPGERVKIYVEDYVMTYLNQVANDKPLGEKAAILLGESVHTKNMDIFFISAAIHIENIEIDEASLHLTSDIWNGLYEKVDKYFQDKHILGWFLSRPGQSIGMTAQIEKEQTKEFADKGPVFYSLDPSDQEEAFYLYDNNHLVKQQGYYIYYERNVAMQNYMIDTRKDETHEENAEANGFQNRLFEHKTDNKIKKEAYTHSQNQKSNAKPLVQIAALVVVALVVVAVRRNMLSGSIPTSQNIDYQMVETDTSSSDSNQEKNTDNLDLVESIVQQAQNDASDTADDEESSDVNQNDEEDQESNTATDEDSTDVSATVHRSYTVQEGDTLVKISRDFYNDTAHIQEIINLNEITDPDYIYPGMDLKLP